MNNKLGSKLKLLSEEDKKNLYIILNSTMQFNRAHANDYIKLLSNDGLLWLNDFEDSILRLTDKA